MSVGIANNWDLVSVCSRRKEVALEIFKCIIFGSVHGWVDMVKIFLSGDGAVGLEPLQLTIDQNSEFLVWCEVWDPVGESQMATM